MQTTFFQKNTFGNQYQSIINQINELEEKFKLLSNTEIRAKAFELKKEYRQNLNLNSYIPESFALTREASSRSLGLRHFDVQLLGGLALNNQKIAEMKTGEGKTLVATLSASLNALTGKGVHIVTVNDYLANRDQVAMGQIYRFLGLSTGLIQAGMSTSEKRQNYNTDITYVTNYELTFDFLRDNLALNANNLVLRPFNYCIIDEVDSILIDEAQTPLIISNNIKTPVYRYIMSSEIIEYLKKHFHYRVDEKNRNIILTDEGSKQVEIILKKEDLYDPKDPWIPYVLNALKAKALFLKNVHYIIQNNRIVIVDEFTGRIMSDRRWGDGLHQAIEAKEGLQIRQRTETVATITYQNFFLLYPKLSGMTGTGKTAELEFEKIYNLSVEEIPTARPKQRFDLPDRIFKDQFAKWNAVTENSNNIAQTKQPILIGTTTVEKSEMLAQLLNEYNLTYQLLNAKPQNVRRESEIIAQAGQQGVITIATNMAGRGTDIILGGNINFPVQKTLYDLLTLSKNYILTKKSNLFDSPLKQYFDLSSQRCLSLVFSLFKQKEFLKCSDIDILRCIKENDRVLTPRNVSQFSIQFLINELSQYYRKHQKQKNQIVKNFGGLYIIGTERNNSLRVDNQLRGRCGRQGDPGTSIFFLSLDDNLLRLFGGPKIQRFMQKQMIDNTPLESTFLTKSLDSAQIRVEERAYQQRKNLFDYDEVLNFQRKLIYFERYQILKSFAIEKNFLASGEQLITDLFAELKKKQIPIDRSLKVLKKTFGKSFDSQIFLLDSIQPTTLKFHLLTEFWLIYFLKRSELLVYGDGIQKNFERSIILITIDQIWRDHLQKMTLLREAVGWRGYGQRNPLYEYKREAFYLFKTRKNYLRQVIVYNILRSTIL